MALVPAVLAPVVGLETVLVALEELEPVGAEALVLADTASVEKVLAETVEMVLEDTVLAEPALVPVDTEAQVPAESALVDSEVVQAGHGLVCPALGFH